jgi:hypothetical protein
MKKMARMKRKKGIGVRRRVGESGTPNPSSFPSVLSVLPQDFLLRKSLLDLPHISVVLQTSPSAASA